MIAAPNMKNIPFVLALTLFAFAGLSGCDTAPASGGPKAKDIVILEAPPQRPYDTLGEVADTERHTAKHGLSQQMDMSQTPDVMDVLRKQAAALGADAIIVTKRQLEQGETSLIRVIGTAIRYRKDGTPAAGAPPPAAVSQP